MLPVAGHTGRMGGTGPALGGGGTVEPDAALLHDRQQSLKMLEGFGDLRLLLHHPQLDFL